MRTWANWRVMLAEGNDGIHDALETYDYAKALAIIEELTTQQAQVSVLMRNILTKAGALEGDEG